MVKIADISRREGLLALENIKTENMILKKACQLIADNADPMMIREMLTIEITSLRRRHHMVQDVFKKMGGYAPSFGMIGTLIGLVQMLASLHDPSTIGPAMAVALLTTFYGAMMASLFFLPMAGKLRSRSQEEVLHLQIIFEGAKCILENNNPRLVYEKLSSFVPPKDRRNER
jgi:chemotaxis protein MotA